MLKTYSVSNINIYIYYYLSGYFRKGVNFVFFSQTVAKIEKSKIKNFTISAVSHSNKGIKHSEDFDKKKFKREYMGCIID
jgi:hypothetical protein